MRKKIDFLCVGFQKSGTTALDTILRQHSQIELPMTKETQYFHWAYRYDKSKDILFRRFFAGEDSKVRGSIEPEFDFFPEEIRRTFGKNIKLLFVMRNPVERLYSFYRMELRQGAKWIRSYYENKSVSQMFDDFVDRNIVNAKGDINAYVERGKYMKCIKNFLHYFPKENMHFIIFDDYIQNPEKTFLEIQSFLGLNYEILNYNVKENIGNLISRNYPCLLANGLLTKVDFFARCNRNIPISTFNKIDSFIGKSRNIICVENRGKMKRRTRKKCEDFYRNDRKELEIFLQRDLSKIWFE